MEENKVIEAQIVHLARLALSGRPQDVQLHVRRMAQKLREILPGAAEGLASLLQESPTRASPLRRAATPAIPVDLDTRLRLVRVESPVHLPIDPIYADDLRASLEQVLREHRERARLERRGLAPTRTALFTGPPGVGKTLAARWFADELQLPLVILDLSAVMSSFLGRTGNNVRHVLDYAKGTPCVLLLDEFDAIAKRRDDSTEVGELKRLVTVLLQEIDDWPVGGLLIAATNHGNLLDPAVWRRFEQVIEFDMPDRAAINDAIRRFLAEDPVDDQWLDALAAALDGASFSDIERFVMLARRSAALSDSHLDQEFQRLLHRLVHQLDRSERIDLATSLVASGAATQRLAHELTGVSRDTIRKRLQHSERM